MSDRIELRRALSIFRRGSLPEGDYLMCRIKPGRDWWDLDDALRALPGHRMVIVPSPRQWHAIPTELLPALEVLAESNPGRLVVHVTN